MFRRMRYQQGCLTQETRKTGPNVWVFRWRELAPDGRRHNKKIVVGTVEQFPTEARARRAVEGLRLEINKETPGGVLNTVTLGQSIAHYKEKELPADATQSKVP